MLPPGPYPNLFLWGIAGIALGKIVFLVSSMYECFVGFATVFRFQAVNVNVMIQRI